MPVFPEKAEQLFALFPNAEYDRLRRGTAQRFIFLWSRFAGAAEQDLRERAEQFRRRMAASSTLVRSPLERLEKGSSSDLSARSRSPSSRWISQSSASGAISRTAAIASRFLSCSSAETSTSSSVGSFSSVRSILVLMYMRCDAIWTNSLAISRSISCIF